MDKGQSSRSEGSPASWTLASTTEGRHANIKFGMMGITLRINFSRSSHEVLAPARSGISGSRLFTSAGGFPGRSGLPHQPTNPSREHVTLVVGGNAPLKKSG